MKLLSKILLGSGILFLISSCSVIHYQTKGIVPLSFSKLPEHNRLVFIEGRTEFYLYGFLPSVNEVFVDEEVKRAGFESMANLAISERTTWKDWLIGIGTLGFYIPRSFTIYGFVLENRRHIQ